MRLDARPTLSGAVGALCDGEAMFKKVVVSRPTGRYARDPPRRCTGRPGWHQVGRLRRCGGPSPDLATPSGSAQTATSLWQPFPTRPRLRGPALIAPRRGPGPSPAPPPHLPSVPSAPLAAWENLAPWGRTAATRLQKSRPLAGTNAQVELSEKFFKIFLARRGESANRPDLPPKSGVNPEAALRLRKTPASARSDLRGMKPEVAPAIREGRP